MLEILANGPTWEICAQKKNKNPDINQCGEKGGGGYYIPVGSVYLKNSEPSVPGIINRIKYEYGRTYLLT
jgi:hypothetical protein